MKKSLLLLVCVLFAGYTKAQNKSWRYDFGTATGNLSPTAAAGLLSANDGDPTHIHSLLPAPADGQIARVWTGNSNVGGFTLATSGTIGSGAKLLFNPAPTTSTTKFSILNIDGTAVMSVGFKLKFEAGTNARYRFAVGRDVSTINWSTASGSTQLSNGTNFNDMLTNLPSFLLMQWDLSSSNYTLKIRKQASSDNNVSFDGWETLNATLNPSVSFVNGGTYDVQLYANNGSASATYTKMGVTQTVAARSCHIWINNTQLLFAANEPNFKDASTGVAANASLNAFIFLGYNNTDPNDSAVHDARAYLDDFVYANYLENINVLPVVLDGFSATKQNNGVLLNWKTLSEKDNAKFEIFRFGDIDQTPKLIKTVTAKGNTTTPTNYSIIDNSPLVGNNYYKLVQIDFNGKADTLATASAKIGFDKSNFNVYAQSANSLRLSINSLADESAALEIYNLSGQCLLREKVRLSAGTNQLTVPATLVTGVYVAVLKTKEDQFKTKFISK
ncbi:T9SS type A sorting domain-containing protein [Pedobacter helvus]|uniref:T9SS type A sorting domain-containing protein n=1 Tax=Pedobacter helvus TaxID=2563444 RepID=A0ABW9JI02_9SPHI|nr:T9SS type A sorting domain-containing protein [Pedobacter ureilyticus]